MAKIAVDGLLDRLRRAISSSQHPPSPAAAIPAPNERYLVKMVRVAAGEFDFGFNPRANEPFEWTRTVSRLKVKGAFHIGETLVTQDLWARIMGNTPSGFPDNSHPVESVTWDEALEFCNKLSKEEGRDECYSSSGETVRCEFACNGYRLPTEVEWEYAARGGTHRSAFLYSGGDSIELVGWYSENSNQTTHPVRSKEPNALGIYDMSGNVWEYCWDKYGDTLYRPILREQPTAKAAGYRVLRGGSWKDDARKLRLSAEGQSALARTSRYNDVGVRVCRSDV